MFFVILNCSIYVHFGIFTLKNLGFSHFAARFTYLKVPYFNDLSKMMLVMIVTLKLFRAPKTGT